MYKLVFTVRASHVLTHAGVAVWIARRASSLLTPRTSPLFSGAFQTLADAMDARGASLRRDTKAESRAAHASDVTLNTMTQAFNASAAAFTSPRTLSTLRLLTDISNVRSGALKGLHARFASLMARAENGAAKQTAFSGANAILQNRHRRSTPGLAAKTEDALLQLEEKTLGDATARIESRLSIAAAAYVASAWPDREAEHVRGRL